MTRRRLIPSALTVVAFAVAFAQRPGDVVADTKVSLYVDPVRFLGDVLSAWTPTQSLGHVFAGQYGGYAWPMAPWFALGDELGLPPWVVHRLWLGTLLALAAWGVVRLLRALLPQVGGVAQFLAGLLYVVNPYVTVYVDRTSVVLLAYAALPWLLLAVHRGLRNPRGWWWPIVFALVLTSTGGGVNAAVTAWVLVGPLLLIVYERCFGGVGRSSVLPFVIRTAVVSAVASAWWIVPVLVHSAYGLDFLPFTEQPGTIWGAPSVSESLRLMGFWTSYIGGGYTGHLYPFAGHGGVLLFSVPVVLAGLLVPALSLSGFRWTRRFGYGPFFLLLTLAALLIMTAGWPEGTPFRRGLTFLYNHEAALQFLRTTYKAGALAALGLACLGGLAAAEGWTRLSRRRHPLGARALGGGAALALVILAAWPLATGRALESQLVFKVPPAWRQVASDLDKRGDATRALVLPGQLFAFRRWGGTIDDVLPALTKRPVTNRYIVPYSDLRAFDLENVVDDLVNQERALPGQLRPLLDLLGVGDVVSPSDGDRARGGGLGPVEAAGLLDGQRGLGPWKAYGPVHRERPYADRIESGRVLPQVRVTRTATAGIVRVIPSGPGTILDGGARGLADLAAFGALDPGRPLQYAGDLSPAAIRAQARAGATIAISDSNRRASFLSSRFLGSSGATIAVDSQVSADGTFLNPFSTRGPDGQTVQQLGGVAALGSPHSPGVTQFPEVRPFAAFDGDLGSEWLADRVLEPGRRHLDVILVHPKNIPFIDLYPYSDSRGRVRQVSVNGVRYAVHRGWNRLPVRLRDTQILSIEMSKVSKPRHGNAGVGGIRELRIPGVHPSERLRPPVLAERALAGLGSLDHTAIDYLLSRVTADVPITRGRYVGEVQAGLMRDARDPERTLRRLITPPVMRSWTAQAWTTVDVRTGDATLDRLTGTTLDAEADSSSRFENRPRNRASRALDGRRASGWIGQWIPGRPAWLQLQLPHAVTLSRLQLQTLGGVRVRRPTRVSIRTEAGMSGPLPVSRNGRVTLPTPLRGRRIRLTVVDAAFPPGTPARQRQRRAVAIGELRGVPGLGAARTPRNPRIAMPCGTAALRAGTESVPLRLVADRGAFEAGRPLLAEGCRRFALPARPLEVRGRAAPLRVDLLRLRAAAPSGPVPPRGGGSVVDPGHGGNGSRDGVRVRVRGTAWLVYGEGYNRGWRASCDGRDLGAPTPLQGFANGWRVDRACRDVTFSFVPNRLLVYGYVMSLVGCLGMLAFLVVRRRRPAERFGVVPSVPDADDTLRRWGIPAALAALVALTLATAFLFSVRAGLIFGPLLAVALWRGLRVRDAIGAATILLVVGTPVAHLLGGHDDRGGYNSNFPVDHQAAHWVALAGLVLLGYALARTLARMFSTAGATASPAPPELTDDG